MSRPREYPFRVQFQRGRVVHAARTDRPVVGIPNKAGVEARDTPWSDVLRCVRISYTVDGPVRLLADSNEQVRTNADTDELLATANDAIDTWNQQHGEERG